MNLKLYVSEDCLKFSFFPLSFKLKTSFLFNTQIKKNNMFTVLLLCSVYLESRRLIICPTKPISKASVWRL